jgi:hypothetical protein
MPSVSKAQQRLMGMAYALKKGDMKPTDASQEVKDLAASMTLQQLKDFAETKHEDLPDHVEEGEVNEWLPGVSAGHKWYTQPAQGAISYGSNIKDHTDKLIQSFIEFIESGKKPKRPNTNKLTEDGEAVAPSSYSAPQASPANTNGMGNVSMPGIGKLGSGDTFGDDEEEEEEEENIGIISYEQFKKMTNQKWQKQRKKEEQQ